MSRYEPSNYMKRVIMFNAQVEASYQATRKAFNDAVFGELTEAEEAEWLRNLGESSGEHQTLRELAPNALNNKIDNGARSG